jgi:hypothetical protein
LDILNLLESFQTYSSVPIMYFKNYSISTTNINIKSITTSKCVRLNVGYTCNWSIYCEFTQLVKKQHQKNQKKPTLTIIHSIHEFSSHILFDVNDNDNYGP